jgi:hypothetical protein
MVKNQFKENEMSETKRRAKYTLEFKLEAVRPGLAKLPEEAAQFWRA